MASLAIDRTAKHPGHVEGVINYLGTSDGPPEYFSQDHSKDNWRPDARHVKIANARMLADPPTVEREGLALVPHVSRVTDFRDQEEVQRVYLAEVQELLREVMGTERVTMFPRCLLRFSPRTPDYMTGENSQPAHFPHTDFSPTTAPGLVSGAFGPAPELRPGEQLIGLNVWRAISGPPQDVPLAVCDSRSVNVDDLVFAKAIFDVGDPPYRTTGSFMLHYHPRHRWMYFPNMLPGEALIFRSYDNSPIYRPAVPHTAFNDPTCPADAHGRVSVEARAYVIRDA